VASSILMLMFGAAVYYSASLPPPGPRWTVTHSTGAHHSLVVHVTAHPGVSLREIGEAIVTPLQGKYDEILIYVKSGTSTLRRIQWTPQRGYVELVIGS
jgi:hypothetical protein